MTKAIIARKQGDEYQALFFWMQLIKLFTDENIQKVIFESKIPAFVDDVVVEYEPSLLDVDTGTLIDVDYFQCKYHVVQSTQFSIEQLINPSFIHSQNSMLQRLYDAYLSIKDSGKSFRLSIVSSSTWDSNDDLLKFLSPEGYLRPEFYGGTHRSKQGKIRMRLTAYLKITEKEFHSFAKLIRFDLGRNRNRMIENINLSLKLANMMPIDKTITDTKYSELAWKFLEQGKSIFDRKVLEGIVQREKLMDVKGKLVVIRHQSFQPLAPSAINHAIPDRLKGMNSVEIVIDQSDLFSNGRLVDPSQAIIRQTSLLQDFQKNADTAIGYYGIAHIPLVFLAGYQLNRRRQVYLFDHNREKDEWLSLSNDGNFPDIHFEGMPKRIESFDGDVVLKMSISYSVIGSDITDIIPAPSKLISLYLDKRKIDIIRYKNQLERYAASFREALDTIHNNFPKVKRVHLFYAGPVPLAFKCGQLISPTIHPKVLVYNYHNQDTPRYKWGLQIPPNLSSSDFLITS